MSRPDYKDLYLAKNIESLQCIAKADVNHKTVKSFKVLLQILDKLYKEAQEDLRDQEKTFIFLCRYLVIKNHLTDLLNDDNFMELRIGKDVRNVEMQYNAIRNSLAKRYQEDKSVGDATPAQPITEVPFENRLFKDDFIDAQELFSALQKKENLLLVDIRPCLDFKSSQIKSNSVINLPEHIITPGLSAHLIGRLLSKESQEIWETRDKFRAIVLYDWISKPDNVSEYLIRIYKIVTEWDYNRNYNEPAVMLKGGYAEWIHRFPGLSTNPRVKYNQLNTDLDELLSLNEITYPDEKKRQQSESETSVPQPQPQPAPVTPPQLPKLESPETSPAKLPEIPIISDDLYQALADYNAKVKAMNDSLRRDDKPVFDIFKEKPKAPGLPSKPRLYPAITQKISYPELIKKDIVEREKKKEVQEDKPRPPPYYVDRETKPKMLRSSAGSLLDASLVEPCGRQDKIRPFKPMSMVKKGNKTKKNRRIKKDSSTEKGRATGKKCMPYVMSKRYNFRARKMEEHAGLVGLRNIKNTCYMNTIIQCFVHLPPIKDLFCSGEYARQLTAKPDAIFCETAKLVRHIYTTSDKFYSPNTFYNKFCSINPNYKLGNHEDCMEFFLIYLNLLIDDTKRDMVVKPNMAPITKVWYNLLQGKTSIFVDLFYYLIKTQQVCDYCDHKNVKYDIESSLILPVPTHDFNLIDLVDDYMAEFIIEGYDCKKCRRQMKNRKKLYYAPLILVLHLKRYKQTMEHGDIAFAKNDSLVHFPVDNMIVDNYRYELHCIALHEGTINYGHYKAAIRIENYWYEFNDDRVKIIDIGSMEVKRKACAFFYCLAGEL